MPDSILITGAGGAIGRAAAQRLAKDGYALVLLDHDNVALAELARDYPTAKIIHADATDARALQAALASSQQPLYGAVLASGVHGPVGPVLEASDDEFMSVLRMNVLSVWVGLRVVLTTLAAQRRGSIVVLSSISGLNGMPMLAPYCASKHAVQGLVKTAAREVASTGVRVNAVAPGPVASPMMSQIDDAFRQLGHERNQPEKNVPLQRYATPEDVAAMIAFLCAPESSYCTGATLTVDGGLTCR